MSSRRGELEEFLQRQLPRGDFVTRNTDKKFKERYNSSQEISHIHVHAHDFEVHRAGADEALWAKRFSLSVLKSRSMYCMDASVCIG